MKVLVTGGAGYLSAVLSLSLIEQGHQVRVLDNLKYGGRSLLAMFGHPRLDLMVGDVRDRSTAERAVEQVDAVVHLAAIVGDPACARDPEGARAINERASLQIARRYGAQNVVSLCGSAGFGSASDPFGYHKGASATAGRSADAASPLHHQRRREPIGSVTTYRLIRQFQ